MDHLQSWLVLEVSSEDEALSRQQDVQIVDEEVPCHQEMKQGWKVGIECSSVRERPRFPNEMVVGKANLLERGRLVQAAVGNLQVPLYEGSKTRPISKSE